MYKGVGDSEADEIQETGRREQGRGWTSDRWGISEILCQSGNWTQWGDRAQTVGENCHGGSPTGLGICAAVEAGGVAADSGEERSKDGGD